MKKLVFNFQRQIAYNIPKGYRGSVLDGRDITHNIVPDATFKFYVTASLAARSRRRYKELKQFNIGTVTNADNKDTPVAYGV